MRESERNSQLEPQLHEEAPPEQPQSPFILMVGLVGGCGVVVVMLELEVGSCFVGLLVMMMTVMGWDGGNGEEMRILIHTEVDNSVRQTGTSFLAFSTGKRIKADSWAAARFVPVSTTFSSAFFVPVAIKPSPAQSDPMQNSAGLGGVSSQWNLE